MTNHEFVNKALDVAWNYNTQYVWGTFGWPVTSEMVTRAITSYPSYNEKRRTSLTALIGTGAFMFDCIGLIKAILWGWAGNSSKTYGGATYGANSVPDIDADTAINRCSGVSTDFSAIVPGEVVWKVGHIGIYIGDGKVVEATPSWKDGVQITACHNIGTISGYNSQSWTKHGKLPYIDYVATEAATETKEKEDAEDVVRYERLGDIPNKNSFQDIIGVLMDAKIINGDGSDKEGNNDIIDLSLDQIRTLVFIYRGGGFDRKLVAAGLNPVVME